MPSEQVRKPWSCSIMLIHGLKELGINMARPNKSGLTPSIVSKLKAEGKTQREIAKMFDVNETYVSWIKSQYPVQKSPREMVNDLWPWDSGEKFHPAAPSLRLRAHLRYRAYGQEGLTQNESYLLKGFYNRLRKHNLVVEFDPTIPKSKGVYTGGWAYRPREDRDGNLIIRVNEYTKDLNEEARMVWEFPPIDPE